MCLFSTCVIFVICMYMYHTNIDLSHYKVNCSKLHQLRVCVGWGVCDIQ